MAEKTEPTFDDVVAWGQAIADQMIVGNGEPGPARFEYTVQVAGASVVLDLYEYEAEALDKVGRVMEQQVGFNLIRCERIAQ